MRSGDWQLIVLLPLAAYFVSWVIVHSAIAQPIVSRWQDFWERRWYRRHPDAPGSEDWKSHLAYLPSCIWCTGFWVSGVMVMLTHIAVPVPYAPLSWLAMVAVIGSLDSLTHHDA